MIQDIKEKSNIYRKAFAKIIKLRKICKNLLNGSSLLQPQTFNIKLVCDLRVFNQGVASSFKCLEGVTGGTVTAVIFSHSSHKSHKMKTNIGKYSY